MIFTRYLPFSRAITPELFDRPYATGFRRVPGLVVVLKGTVYVEVNPELMSADRDT